MVIHNFRHNTITIDSVEGNQRFKFIMVAGYNTALYSNALYSNHFYIMALVCFQGDMK